MRIRTSTNYEYRLGLYDDVGALLGESTRSGAIDGACEFTQEMIGNLEQAVEHPDMTEELAEVLSISVIDVEYRVETGVNVR